MIRRSPRTGLPIIPKAPPRPSARCGDPPPARLLAGIAQFNAGEYWHCHETLEGLWRGEADPVRSLYQGILLVAVALYHVERSNRRGAMVKLEQALERLEPFRPACMGVDVEALVQETRTVLADVAGDGSLGGDGRRVAVVLLG